MDKSLNRIKEVFEEQGIKQTWLAKRVGKKNCCVVNSYICYRQQPIRDAVKLQALFQYIPKI